MQIFAYLHICETASLEMPLHAGKIRNMQIFETRDMCCDSMININQ